MSTRPIKPGDKAESIARMRRKVTSRGPKPSVKSAAPAGFAAAAAASARANPVVQSSLIGGQTGTDPMPREDHQGAAAMARALGLDPVEVSLRSKPYDYVLTHVREVSQNARSTWFGLIAMLLFCGITLLGVEDRDFFAYGAETALPVMGLSVPTAPFFVTAPLAVLALYTYLHVYLVKLWRSLAAAPPRYEGRALDELVFPWLLSDAALQWRKDGAFRRPFGRLSAFISWLLGWAAGPIVLALFWLRSAPAHHEGLTIYLSLLLAFGIWIGWRSRRIARRAMAFAMQDISHEELVRTGPMGRFTRWVVFPVVVALLVVASWEMTEGGLTCPTYDGTLSARLKRAINCTITANAPGLIDFGQSLRAEQTAEAGTIIRSGLVPADMAEAALSVKPQDWVDRDLARSVYRRSFAQGLRASLRPAEPLPFGWEEEADAEFSAQRREYLSRIPAKDLEAADLRDADLSSAFLASARLRAARLDGADLRDARLEGASLADTSLIGADLQHARAEATVLNNARLNDALLHDVHLGEAVLNGADLTGASLIDADMQRARAEYAIFSTAKLHGAKLSGASLTDTDFTDAQIWSAWLDGADLSWSRFAGASLDGSYLAGANLEGATGITQAMLASTFGDDATVLPEGLTAPSHWRNSRIQSRGPGEDPKDLYLQWRKEEFGQ